MLILYMRLQYISLYFPLQLYGLFQSSVEFSMFHNSGEQIVMFSHTMRRSSHTRQGDAFASGRAVGTSRAGRIPQHSRGPRDPLHFFVATATEMGQVSAEAAALLQQAHQAPDDSMGCC